MKTIKRFYLISLLLLTANFLSAQSYKVADNTKVQITGTSTMHDWESEVKTVSGNGNITVEGDQITAISSLNLTFVVKSIESDKSKMNSLTYEALKQEKHPNITLKITKINSISNNAINAAGELTIAGQTKPVTLQGKGSVSGNTVKISGEYQLDMTAYGVEPPSLMLGTITVDKMVTIKYDLVLTK